MSVQHSAFNKSYYDVSCWYLGSFTAALGKGKALACSLNKLYHWLEFESPHKFVDDIKIHDCSPKILLLRLSIETGQNRPDWHHQSSKEPAPLSSLHYLNSTPIYTSIHQSIHPAIHPSLHQSIHSSILKSSPLCQSSRANCWNLCL